MSAPGVSKKREKWGGGEQKKEVKGEGLGRKGIYVLPYSLFFSNSLAF